MERRMEPWKLIWHSEVFICVRWACSIRVGHETRKDLCAPKFSPGVHRVFVVLVLEVAVASAKEIDEKDYWYRLGFETLRQGNHEIVEYSYQKTKSFERLSFLYLITGNLEKLSKMLKIAEMQNDVTGRFHNALYLGDVKERVKILEDSGLIPLAYVTTAIHGLTKVVVESRKEVDDVKELLGISKEYVLTVRIELIRREEKDNVVRQNELVAYFTHCNLQPTHLKISLKSAMTISYKSKNYNTTASFGRRLLELNLTPVDASKTRQVLQAFERAPRDEMQLNYDPCNPFVVCGSTFTPIYRGSEDFYRAVGVRM